MTVVQKILALLLPHKDIVKNGVLYLRRHFLSPNFHWLPRVYLHLINRPDGDRDPHDHPGWFITIPLWGGYWEEIYNGPEQTKTGEHQLHFSKLWWPAFRPAKFIHKLTVLPRGRAWTLVIFGPNRRTWGFWTKEGFVVEKDYLKAEDRV